MKNPHYITFVLLLLMMLSGILIVCLGIADYPHSQKILNFTSPDGSLEFFTLSRYQIFRIPLILSGGLFLILGCFGLAFFNQTKRLTQRTIYLIKFYLKRLWCDLKHLWFDVKNPGFNLWEWIILVALILLAFVGRWIWIERPMMHDESYTFIAFSQQPIIQIISDYHLPNNHVFNSILIHVLYSIFGNISPLIVRLPSLIAGVLCVLLVYIWQRKQSGISTAIVAATFVSYFPWLKLQSTNGRGYMLMAMFTLLMLILAHRIQIKKDLAAWVILTIVTVLNFYTLPITLYPFGIILFWLLLLAINGDVTKEYGGFFNFFRYLVAYGLMSVFLTFLIYSPIFLIGSGWNSFFNNPFVESLNWYSFTQTLPVRFAETLQEWQMGVPSWYWALLWLGLILSIIYSRKVNSGKISLQLSTFIVLSLIFIVQRPNPWARIWTFLLPILLAWAAAGWYFFISGVFRKGNYQKISQKLVLSTLLIITLVLSITHITSNLQYYNGELGQEETVTLELKRFINQDDVVLTPVGFGPSFWYYFDLHDMPINTIVNPDLEKDWKRIFIIIDDREHLNTIETFNGNQIVMEACPINLFIKIYEYGHYQVVVSSREIN